MRVPPCCCTAEFFGRESYSSDSDSVGQRTPSVTAEPCSIPRERGKRSFAALSMTGRGGSTVRALRPQRRGSPTPQNSPFPPLSPPSTPERVEGARGRPSPVGTRRVKKTPRCGVFSQSGEAIYDCEPDRGPRPGFPNANLRALGVRGLRWMRRTTPQQDLHPPIPAYHFQKIPIFSNFYVSFFIFIRLISRGHEAS